MKVLVAAVLVVGAVQLAPAPVAHAEVSAACWAHLAELPAGSKTTAAGDVRYHRMRGEFSPCSEQEAAEVDGSSDRRDRDGEKSRYCKKRWFC